jgi:DNA polymerase-3 subunit delta'
MLSHHAYLIIGTHDAVLPALKKLVAYEEGNIEFIEMVSPALSVDDARDIFTRTRTSVPEGSRRIVIVSCTQATHEAQNALLKATEEPGERTHFFFLVPSAETLLPTLRSRLETLSLETDEEMIDVSAFMHGTFEKRAEILEPIIEEKQHDRALALCNGIEQKLSGDTMKYAETLRTLEIARTYLAKRGSSLKLILEFVALSVPKI